MVPLMVSSKPVHTVSAMKKRSVTHKRQSGDDPAEGSLQGGEAGTSGGGEASVSAAARSARWATGPEASSAPPRSHKSGRVVWTLPGDADDDPERGGEPSAHAREASGGGGGAGGGGSGRSRRGPSDTGQSPKEGARLVGGAVPQDAAEPPGMV